MDPDKEGSPKIETKSPPSCPSINGDDIILISSVYRVECVTQREPLRVVLKRQRRFWKVLGQGGLCSC
jgi:hypothetical protein